MLHGAQRGLFDLRFEIPSRCAALLASEEADIGIVPAIELRRQPLKMIHGVGIASHGAVRSILLVSQCPLEEVRTLAADMSSRTSVALAQLILARRYNSEPRLIRMAPEVNSMLTKADAAVIIGDPALRVDPAALSSPVYDLGHEWKQMTGLPMVYAVWAGRSQVATAEVGDAFRESYRFGRDHMSEIINSEAAPRRLPEALAHEYLTRMVVHELGPAEYEGLNLFLELAGKYCAVYPESEKVQSIKP
jgi:predicted solute-binding protein